MSYVTLNGVTRAYGRGERRITPLDHVDLQVEEGEFFVLLGPSGSGKSTLLNIVAGIDAPDEGEVQVAGIPLHTMNASRLSDWRAEHVGYIFQQHNLVPVLTAYENVELPLGLFRLSRRERHARVSLALQAVGLADRAEHFPRQLSGGQEQRVAIARAIVANPPLLVADEPTGNLDADSADAILELLQRLNRERGTTIMMVTHDPHAAERGSRAMRLDKGRLADLDGRLAS